MPDLPETMVTVEFHAQGASTKVVLTHEGFPNEMARDAHSGGWTGCMECLAATLSGAGKSSITTPDGKQCSS